MIADRHIDKENIVNSLRLHDPYFDADKINNAIKFALYHNKNKDEAGNFYYNPLETAEIVLTMHLDTNSVIAALLHGAVDDNNLTLEAIENTFGSEVAKLINGVNKLSKIEFSYNNINQVENFRRLLLALSTDLRIILIKLADRLHNMRVINFIQSPEKRKLTAIETIEIYAPLAERMGMHQIKVELQDICFRLIHPEISESILNRLKIFSEFNNDDLINKTIEGLYNNINNAGIKAEIHGRRKTPYSIWMKMKRKNISLEELSDIIAIRIIVDNVVDCYRVVGIIHTTYITYPEGFHDFISIPKSNGYKSIHTVITTPSKQRVEIQIRTKEMHKVAELGVAAHWRYKQKNSDFNDNSYYKWINEMVAGLSNSGNLSSFLENTRLEMYYDQVFCFTPKGTLIVLPKGATAIDFAYAVHSNIGNRCVGAKINDHVVPLKYILKNGDQVEIITSRNQTPWPLWEKSVITSKARYEIRKYLRIHKREQHIKLGQTIIYKILKEANITEVNKALDAVCSLFEKQNIEDLLCTIGEGTIKREEIIKYLAPEQGVINSTSSSLKFRQEIPTVENCHNNNDNETPEDRDF